eukprot:5272568-Amphidinium_carterae.1
MATQWFVHLAASSMPEMQIFGVSGIANYAVQVLGSAELQITLCSMGALDACLTMDCMTPRQSPLRCIASRSAGRDHSLNATRMAKDSQTGIPAGSPLSVCNFLTSSMVMASVKY